jgi:hypothetical protein
VPRLQVINSLGERNDFSEDLGGSYKKALKDEA